MKKQTVLLVLVLAVLVMAAGLYVRRSGVSVTAIMDAHR